MEPTIIPLSQIFIEALPVIKEIQNAGQEAYFVGGSIRDALLNLPVNDVDIATSAMPEEVKSIFKRTIDIGIEHGTVMVLWKGTPYEVTTFRTESTYTDHRRPDKVEFVRSLKEDLKRRDFTMNAMALSADGTLIDYFNGQEAIKNKRIETVGHASERFNEDALRMMRAVRFQSQLGFHLEEKTQAAIEKYSALLEKIAVERIRVEFEKLLLGKWRTMGLKTMLDTNLYKFCPGFSEAKEALNEFSKVNYPLEGDIEAWSLLCYYLEKYIPSFQLRKFLRSWKLSNRVIDGVEIVLDGLKNRPSQPENNPMYLFELGIDSAIIVEKIQIAIGKNADLKAVLKAYQELPIKTSSDLAITGNDLIEETNKKPGPWIGEMIQEALNAVVCGQVVNDKDELLKYLLS